jgi:hypothetical protein
VSKTHSMENFIERARAQLRKLLGLPPHEQ